MDFAHKLYKKINTPFIKASIKLNITANKITLFNLLFTLAAGCYFFAVNNYLGALGVMAVNVFLDYLDGDIAKGTNTVSNLGIWLDNYGDVILQNAIMGALAYGCYNQGLPVWVIIVFFVSNASLNMISFQYNEKFGFESYNGNMLFRTYMDWKKTILNRIFKNLIDPTASGVGIVLGTVRYWIILGALFGVMPVMFSVITILHLIRALFMYIIYAVYITGSKKLWLFQALAILDEERDEYYRIRYSQKV